MLRAYYAPDSVLSTLHVINSFDAPKNPTKINTNTIYVESETEVICIWGRAICEPRSLGPESLLLVVEYPWQFIPQSSLTEVSLWRWGGSREQIYPNDKLMLLTLLPTLCRPPPFPMVQVHHKGVSLLYTLIPRSIWTCFSVNQFKLHLFFPSLGNM